MLALSSRPRTVAIDNELIEVQRYQIDAIRKFQPTLVIDCAFLTRERMLETGVDSFIETNRELMKRGQEVAEFETVRKFIGLSSGAAKPHLKLRNSSYRNDPYGALKAEYELRLTRENYDVARKVVICRPYSLSGRFVRNRTNYAFFDIIDQAKKNGTVFLKSRNLVFRRYTDAEELMALSMASSPGGAPLESGGELIELGDLAKKIIQELNLNSKIQRGEACGPEDTYFSDGTSFDLACSQAGLIPSSLADQIRNSVGLGEIAFT